MKDKIKEMKIETKIGLLNYLSQWAALNDELLQAYRSMFLTFQSIIMAIGVAFFVTIMVIDKSNSSCIKIDKIIISFFLYIVLLFIYIYNKYSIMPKMKEILDSRSLNNDFFHFKIMKLENSFKSSEPDESDKSEYRYFTQFAMKYKKMVKLSKMKINENLIINEDVLKVFNFSPKEKLDDYYILDLLFGESTGTQNLFHSVIPSFIHRIWLWIIIISTIYFFYLLVKFAIFVFINCPDLFDCF